MQARARLLLCSRVQSFGPRKAVHAAVPATDAAGSLPLTLRNRSKSREGRAARRRHSDSAIHSAATSDSEVTVSDKLSKQGLSESEMFSLSHVATDGSVRACFTPTVEVPADDAFEISNEVTSPHMRTCTQLPHPDTVVTTLCSRMFRPLSLRYSPPVQSTQTTYPQDLSARRRGTEAFIYVPHVYSGKKPEDPRTMHPESRLLSLKRVCSTLMRVCVSAMHAILEWRSQTVDGQSTEHTQYTRN